jgi:uncharacterized membrane protein YGL010W
VAQKKSVKTEKPVPLTGADFYFAKYAAVHQQPANKLIHFICIPLLILSIMGLLWVIPFPYIKFLGAYNADFNWSSFFIAACIYFYLKLSPISSYFMLLILFLFSYAITLVAQGQKAGGPSLAILSAVVFAISVILLYIGYKKEGKKLSFEYRYKNILIAPLYMLHLILSKLSIKH